MQVEYPKKLPSTHWDPVHLTYPVIKFPNTGVSSTTIAGKWRGEPEVIKDMKRPIEKLKEYFYDYNVTKGLAQSQTKYDYGFKLPETKRFNKHTSCTENKYIYPPARKLTDQLPHLHAHETTEMRRAYTAPIIPARLITDKNQFKHPADIILSPPPAEPSWHKELEPLDTTHEGYEKYLDPYLTTSRLHHRPYTADQLNRLPCSKETATYYTFANIPWVRTVKPCTENWRLPLCRPKSMYDREKFKEDFREIRTHNRMRFVPGSFRTEVKDNYSQYTAKACLENHGYEKDVRTYYQHRLANLSTNTEQEYPSTQNKYNTENSIYGSRKPLCSVLDQFKEKNKKLIKKNSPS